MFYLRGSRSEATVKAEVRHREPSTPSAPVSHCSPSLEREGVQVHQSGGFMGFFTTMSVARCWVEDARSRSASQPTALRSRCRWPDEPSRAVKINVK